MGSAEGDIDRRVYDRFFAGQTGACFEIGAARPDWLSIGALYRSKGWDVLSVEPNPTFAAMHRRLGHDVAECAAGHEDRDHATFTIVDCHGAAYRDGAVSYESWSSLALKPDYAAIAPRLDTRQITVPIRRADRIIAESRPNWRCVDLIAVDVEGWELEALSGLSFDRFRPKALIVENLFLRPNYRRFMRERGYTLWHVSFPNEVWVRGDMLATPERVACEARAAVVTTALRLRLLAGKVKRAVHLPARKRGALPGVRGGADVDVTGIDRDLALNAGRGS